jgi:hypothetical protein
MSELMYGRSTTLIAFGLLVYMLLSMELGFQIGRRKQAIANESARSQVNTIHASMLGLLALLLGLRSRWLCNATTNVARQS